MESSIAVRQRAEARMWRAVLRLVDLELVAAFAQRDRQAVRRLSAEAHELRSLGAGFVALGPDPRPDSRGA